MTQRYASVVLLSAALTTFALASTTGERTPVATITGAARSCVRLNSIKVSRIRDDRTIDFMTGNRTGYRNVLPAACRGHVASNGSDTQPRAASSARPTSSRCSPIPEFPAAPVAASVDFSR